MSCYEWEEGKWTLPSASASEMRKQMRTLSLNRHKETLAKAKELHAACGSTRNVDAYRKNLSAVRRAGKYQNIAYDDAEDVLQRQLYTAKKVAAPTAAIVDRVAPRLNTTMKRYELTVGGEGFIALEGRTLEYYSGENNHQLEYVAKDPVYQWMTSFLSRVKWTRGTGGETRGNNEYNEDEWGHRAGAYLVDTWGPLGDNARIENYMRNGFSVTQARQMVKAAKSRR